MEKKTKSIFDGAKFGDYFVTRDGRKAIYVGKSIAMSYLIVEGEHNTNLYFSTGGFSLSGENNPLDIVKRCET